MGEISDLGRAFLRDYVIDGVPASGAFDPPKALGRQVFDLIDFRAERSGIPFNNLVAFLRPMDLPGVGLDVGCGRLLSDPAAAAARLGRF